VSIQLLNGLVLINGGSIATDADCCCDDPCIECQPCPTCWNSLSDPCADIDSVAVTISDVVDDTSSTCDCDSVNGTYSISPDTEGCTWVSWFPISDCVINLGGIVRVTYNVQVAVRWAFNANTDYAITDLASLLTASAALGLSATSNSKFCNSITINKGHYIHVRVTQSFVQNFPFLTSSFQQDYLFKFNNSDIKPGCPDDQIYGLCSGLASAGIATHVFSQKYLAGTPRATTTCDNDLYVPYACDFSGASVLIGSPVITTGVTPPPP